MRTIIACMWIPLQDLRQTLRVLLPNYLHPLHVLNPCVSSDCLSTTPAKSVRCPQVLPKIETKLEKSLGSQFNIQLQQQMGVFQASMLEAMKSLRDKFQSLKETSKWEVDQTFLPLSLVLVNSPRTWTQPLQELNLLLGRMRLWMWTYMAHPFLLTAEVNSPFRTLTRDIISEIINLCMNLT